MRTYAIGDVHGHRDKLERAHALVEADRRRAGDHEAPLVHLGDLVDRGPDSAGVLSLLIEGIEAGHPWVVTLGNHDRLFRRFLGDPREPDLRLREGLDWLHPNLGGAATLASYGVRDAARRPVEEVHAEALARVPAAHRDFLHGLPLWVERGETLFVHAGILPDMPLHLQEEDDLVWIRMGFVDDPQPHPWLVVHGHTALQEPTHFGNRVDLDSGAGHGRRLTAAVFEGRDVWVLTEDGRAPLRPPR
jgi:serine/threonine protein phosphatase 1